jgi:hypothetical protein
MMGKRLNRSEGKAFLHQTGKIPVRMQSSDSELQFDTTINIAGSLLARTSEA